MTFSILARLDGEFGMAVTSSSPAVAARCLHLRPGVGGVASQNITDPRYGKTLLDELAAGQPAHVALDALTQADTTSAYRQIMMIGRDGAPVAFSGEFTLGVNAVARGETAVSAGNLLDNEDVPRAALRAYEAATGDLETRLLAGLHAGLEAGGEAGELHSAGLSVTSRSGWNRTDLRVDWSDSPIAGLSALLDVWLPQRDDYLTRGVDPSTAPSYGVPGDE